MGKSAPGKLPDVPREGRDLRPRGLSDFIGQVQVVSNLTLAMEAARQRKETLDHILLSGPPGLGKTTLAHIIASEMKANIRETVGPAIDKPGDLAGILSGLLPGDVLFIDEIHNLKRDVSEYLYSAMEDFRIAIRIGEGATASSLTINLSPFTLIGATTREGRLAQPFRSRFGIRERLDLYTPPELERILTRSAAHLAIAAEPDALQAIADRARGSARIANGYLRRIRDVAQVHHDGIISTVAVDEGMTNLGVDRRGLCDLDRRILQCLARTHRPVGLKTIASSVGEEEFTIEDTYEPWLLQQGLTMKTSSGRVIMPPGREHLRALGALPLAPVPHGASALW